MTANLTVDRRWTQKPIDEMVRTGMLMQCLKLVPIKQEAVFNKKQRDVATTLAYGQARLNEGYLPMAPQARFEMHMTAADGQIERSSFMACWRKHVAGPLVPSQDWGKRTCKPAAKTIQPPSTEKWLELFLVDYWPNP